MLLHIVKTLLDRCVSVIERFTESRSTVTCIVECSTAFAYADLPESNAGFFYLFTLTIFLRTIQYLAAQRSSTLLITSTGR